jgi:hypothetical protein
MFPTAQIDRTWAEWPPVRDAEDAFRFIEAMGACLFHRKSKVAIPALSDVVAPEPEIDGHPMIWKDILHESGRVYYGMAVRRDTSFVMPDLLPAFYRLQGKDAETYLDQYDRGIVSSAEVRVLHALEHEGQMSTRDLRRAAGLSEKSAFTAATNALRRTLTITQAYSMSRVRAGYEYVWDLFERLYPEVGEAAAVRYPDPAEAITAVADRCAIWIDSPAEAKTLCGW